MDHAATKPFRGDVDKALTFVVTALTPIGFRVERTGAESVDLFGPPMQRTRQSALVGASRIRLAHRGGQLALEAELGGVRRITRFVLVFPIALCLFLGLVFSVINIATGQVGAWLPAGVAIGVNIVVWLVIGPIVVRHLRKKTLAALDTLLVNAVAVGGSRS